MLSVVFWACTLMSRSFWAVRPCSQDPQKTCAIQCHAGASCRPQGPEGNTKCGSGTPLRGSYHMCHAVALQVLFPAQKGLATGRLSEPRKQGAPTWAMPLPCRCTKGTGDGGHT